MNIVKTTKTKKMEKFKLISMTDFVLEESKNRQQYDERFYRCYAYANFLKQPLKLEMFVPCDDEGNVVKKPKMLYYDSMTGWSCPQDEIDYEDKMRPYEQAKEKVLFEGCSISKLMPDNYYQVYCDSDRILWLSWNKSKTIEDLILSNLTLTESAKKQIGI